VEKESGHLRQGPVAVGFVGHSGSGKTTVLERLLPVLRERGLKVGYLKNTHKGFQMDRAGKDTDRLFESGADRVALKAFFALADEWQLSRDEAIALLGAPSERTFYRWRSGKVSNLPKDTLERISVLMGIYKAAHILLPDAERANAYVRRPSSAFDNESALDVMLKGKVENLYQVRRYLDAWRG